MDINKHTFSSKKESKIFRTHENGRILFYPWVYPGESFYVNEEQKDEISKVSFIIGCLMFLAIVGVNILAHYKFIDSFSTACVHAGIWVIFPFWYGYSMYCFTKNMEPFVPAKKSMPAIFYVLLFFLFIRMLTIVTGFYAYQTLPAVGILILIEGFYAIALITLISLAVKTKGYFLTKHF